MLFPPCVVVDFFFDDEERRYAITRRQRKEHKKGRNSPAQVKTPRTRTPFVRSFPALFIHSICHAGGEIQKRSICIYKAKRKQTMKKRAPTLPPTIIDRGLSMIAMRVTFSRACARARKKKVILYARANARKCARESEDEMKKNIFRYRYKMVLFRKIKGERD